MGDLVCAPTMQPGAVRAGDVIGTLCPHCHHSNVVHDTHRNVCALCDLQQLTAHLRDVVFSGRIVGHLEAAEREQ